MTCFPIAVGTGPRKSSSLPFPKFDQSKRHQADDGSYDDFSTRGNEADEVMTMGNNEDDSLAAIVFIKYRFLPVSDVDHERDGLDVEGTESDNNKNLTKNHISETANESNPPQINNEGVSLPNMNNSESTDHSTNGEQSSSYITFNVIAELRVQIQSSTAPFTSNIDAMYNRETKCRVPMGLMRRRGRTAATSSKDEILHQNMKNYESSELHYTEQKSLQYKPIASVVFSSNESHLACLIPFPAHHERVSPSIFPLSENDQMATSATSTVVIFSIQSQLLTTQQKTRHHRRILPPLPDYVTEKSHDDGRNSYEELRAGIDEKDGEEVNPSIHHDDGESTKEASVAGGGETFATQNERQKYRPPRRDLYSFVPHQPRIVRLPQQTSLDIASHASKYFQQKLSKGRSTRSVPPSPPLQSATSICDIPTDHYRGKSSRASSSLLIGTSCGSLLLVDYSSARVRSKLRGSFGDEEDSDSDDEFCHSPIMHVSQCPPSAWRPLDIYGEEQGSKSKGRIALIRRNGSVAIFATSFVVPSAESTLWLRSSSTFSDTDFSRSSSMTNGGAEVYRKQSLLPVLEKLSNLVGKNEPKLPYIRAKWLSPVLLVLLRRPQHWDDEFFVNVEDVMSASSEVVLAQVWAIEDAESVDSITSIEYSNASLISELKRPLGGDDCTKERAHCTFTQHAHTSSMDAFMYKPIGFSQDLIPSFLANCECSLSISYHRNTDCLTLCTQQATHVVSSSKFSPRQFNVHSCCLIWDWKLNCASLAVASNASFSMEAYNTPNSPLPSFFSRLYISKDSVSRLCAVHVYEKVLSHGYRMIQKDAYELGILSPHGTTHDGNLFINEPSPLLLLSGSVLYPCLGSSSLTPNAHIRWEESNIPQSYLLSNGECRLAALSSEGRSIAVAANRGLCILDLSRRAWAEMKDNSLAPRYSPQWKLFSNLNDEQCFRVEHFVWWDRNGSNAKEDDEENRADDILVAIVQYSHSDVSYIVGWSRRRLGFGDDQLFVDVSTAVSGHEQQDVRVSGAGIPLHGSRSQSISIITDPYTKNRALLLVTFDVPVIGGDSIIKYAVYQLQTHQRPQRKSETVLSRLFASGSTTLASQSATGIFLAGGSFSFQLNTEQEYKEPKNTSVAVIGVVTLLQELIVLCVFESNHVVYFPMRECADSPHQRAKGLIVSYFKADSFSYENCSRITWNISKNDGSVYCWAVPCENSRDRGTDEVYSAFSGLDLERPSIGEFCYLGHSSLWMNGASTNENEASIGPFNKAFGCNLFAGQRSRKIMIPSSVDEFFASLHVSNCIVGPPRFTSMLFISFLSLASKTYNSRAHIRLFDSHYVSQSCSEFFKHYIQATLCRVENLSALSAIRIIIFKVIELLTDATFKDDTCTIWLAGKKLLGEVLTAMTKVFDILTVTNFFLSVGRQLEPHQFNLIFPLPNGCEDTVDISTAEDLFSISHDQGSLSTVLSALPLFSCHRTSQKRVVQLVYHCLGEIEGIFESYSTSSLQVSVEEVKFIHQLFWFGVKLEDAIESLEHGEESESSRESSTDNSEGPSVLTSSSEDGESISNDDSPENIYDDELPSPQSLKNGSPKTGVLSKITTHFSPSKNPTTGDANEDEDAINYAASRFILSGFDSQVICDLSTPLPVRQDIARSMCYAGCDEDMLPGDSSGTKIATIPYSDVTVAGAVTVFISHVIGLSKSSHLLHTTNPKAGWKTVSAVAYLLQGDRETVAIASAASAVALNISKTSTIKVAHQFIREEGDGRTIILQFLRCLIFECAAQVDPEAAGVIFNLILILLLRYDTCEDVHASRTTLIIVGIVSGHISGRISELIDLSLSSPMQSIYCDLVHSLPNS